MSDLTGEGEKLEGGRGVGEEEEGEVGKGRVRERKEGKKPRRGLESFAAWLSASESPHLEQEAGSSS